MPFLGRRALAASLSLLAACSSPAPSSLPPLPPEVGPQGGLIEVDAAAISDPRGSGSGGGTGAPLDAGPAPRTDAGPARDASPPPTCTGVPLSCSAAAPCAAVQGCHAGGTCGGFSVSCFDVFSETQCYGTRGCYWSSVSNSCAGTSWSCDLFTGQLSCVDQRGCSWSSACTGSPTPCSLLPAASCATQPGCSLE